MAHRERDPNTAKHQESNQALNYLLQHIKAVILRLATLFLLPIMQLESMMPCRFNLTGLLSPNAIFGNSCYLATKLPMFLDPIETRQQPKNSSTLFSSFFLPLTCPNLHPLIYSYTAYLIFFVLVSHPLLLTALNPSSAKYPMSHFEAGNRYNKRGSLRLDSLSGQTDDEASNGSPSSTAATNSPKSAFQVGSASLVHPHQNGVEEDDKEPSSGPQRQSSSSSSAVKSDKEKRKRSRVTPEQLVRLEQYFAMDRSPTASRRREISDILGMQERQTQIWFQNRRAKAKLQDGKEGSRGASTEVSQDIPREISSNFEVDLQSLIYEDHSVTLIPCSDLTVGTWHRIASSESKHDLIAYISEAKQRLNWFIHSDGYGFKMEIPFETVTDAQFQPGGPGSGFATFFLSQPPLFYIETVSTPQADGTISRGWKRCSDWTQGHQATEVLQHTLAGSATQLVQIIRALQTFKRASEPSTTYRADPPISRPMEIPPPPLAGLNGAGFSYSEMTRPTNFGYMDHMRKRSSYSALESRYTPEGDLRPTSQSAPVEVKHTPYLPPDNYRWNSNQSAALPSYSTGSPRPYSIQDHRYYNPGPRSLQDFQPEVGHPPNASNSAMLYDASSPRLLTTPYYPSTNVSSTLNSSSSSQAPSDRTGITYEFDEDLRSRRSH